MAKQRSITRYHLWFLLGNFFMLSTIYLIFKGITTPRAEVTTSQTITSLHHNKILIIAAYHDNRKKNLVRLIAIVRRMSVKELYCGLTCSNTASNVSMQKVNIDYIASNFGFPYVVAYLLCPIVNNCDPIYVSIHFSDKENGNKVPKFEIRNGKPGNFSSEFTVCISTMFGNNTNVLQYTQAIEMFKLLGAQKVMIYKHSCSPLMDKVLQHYIAEGTVEVIPWPIDLYLTLSKEWHYSMAPGDLGYYGQLATLNDCLYRNMYTSKYVVLTDLDEIILPRKHQNWSMMMSDLQKQQPHTSVFYFQNEVFPTTVFDMTFSKSTWNAVPGINMLEHIYRLPKKPESTKMIVNPRKVTQTSVHTVMQYQGAELTVPLDIAFMYHCRETPNHYLPVVSLIRDSAIWNYSSTLIQQTEMILNVLSTES